MQQGLIILTIQARSPALKPPQCDPSSLTTPCEEIHGSKAAMLFIGLYLVALGVGGIKGSLPTHGAEQFDAETPKGRKQRSTFFNYFVFCLSCGGLIAVTFVVWIEDNEGWQWGFGIATISILLSIFVFLAGSASYRSKIPSGSPLTTISRVHMIQNYLLSDSFYLVKVLMGFRLLQQVLMAATINACTGKTPSNAVANLATSPLNPIQPNSESKQGSKPFESLTKSLGFLNRAVVTTPVHPALACTVQQVEEIKIVIKILPIFACTIILNCCLAQLSTFSIEQAATMDTKVGSLKVPPASLPVFPVVFIMILAPVYDHFIIPFARKVTKSEMGITHLQRIGIGLFLSILAMAVAALVEIKRKRVATNQGLLESTAPLPVTFFWIAFQYLFLGSADLFTLAGLLEFFFTEAPTSMRSLATALSWASLAVGYYLSTVIVSIVNNVTGNSGHKAWLSGSNINQYHLERFYWVMCVLSAVNFLQYLIWAMRYKYRSTGATN